MLAQTAPNKCNCPHGTPVNGFGCTTMGAQMCETCDEGFTLNSGKTACVPITTKFACTCPNGTPGRGPCAFERQILCVVCNTGHKLVGKECRPINRCVCPNGVPATGSDCPAMGANKCSDCAGGYHMIDDKTSCMRDYPCICPKGTPKSGLCKKDDLTV